MSRCVDWDLSTFRKIGMPLLSVSGQSKNIPRTCIRLHPQLFSFYLDRSGRWQHYSSVKIQWLFISSNSVTCLKIWIVGNTALAISYLANCNWPYKCPHVYSFFVPWNVRPSYFLCWRNGESLKHKRLFWIQKVAIFFLFSVILKT